MDVSDFFQSLSAADVVDILAVAALLYGVAVAFRRSKAVLVLSGILIFSSLYVVARVAELRLTDQLFRGFFTVILVALVVIFQEELRRFFEQVAVRSLRRGARARQALVLPQIEVLVSTLTDLAEQKIGALIVLEPSGGIERHVHGGILLDGVVSEPLLKSLFDPSSSGHDGAVMLAGDRVTRFACHLPLSTDSEQLKERGTRHAAALGLAERTDALCLVVSEERGTVSVAQDAKLSSTLGSVELTQVLEEFYRRTEPRALHRMPRVWSSNLLPKLGALVLSALLWFFLVHESAIEYRTFYVPVGHTGIPPGLEVESRSPNTVAVVVYGPRRSFYFAADDEVELTARLFDVYAGKCPIAITASDLRFPVGWTIVNIVPRIVEFSVRRVEPPEEP